MSQMLNMNLKTLRSSNVYHSTQGKQVNGKMTRGFQRGAELVTYPFDAPTVKKLSSRAPSFNLKVSGNKKNFYAFDGGPFGSFIEKQGEASNIIGELQLIPEHESLEQQLNAEIKNKHMLQERKKNNGSLDSDDSKKLKKYEKKIANIHKEMEEVVKKIYDHYCSFMGNEASVFKDIVNKHLMQPTTHMHPCFDMKKLAYYHDATLGVTGRAEEHDDKADDSSFTDPDIKFLWTMVSEEKEVLEPRGLTLQGVQECFRQHAISVGGYNRAEIQRRYMENHGLYPSCLSLPVKCFAELLVEMNKNLPLLPCAKDNKEYVDNDDVPWGNIQMTQMELCNVLLDSMPKDVQIAFNAQNPLTQLRFDIQQLSAELQPLVDQIRIKKNAEKSNNGGGKQGNNSGNSNANSNSNSRSRGSGNRGNRNGNNSGGGNTPKHCDRCKKHGGNPKSHNTNECLAWNADGSPGPRNKQNRKSNNAIAEELAELRSQVKELNSHKRGRSGRSSRKHKKSSRRSRDRSYSRSRSRSRSRSYDSYE